MRLRHWIDPSTTTPTPPTFETLRELVAMVAPATPLTSPTRQLFVASRLRCHKGGRTICGDQCLQCDRLVGILPSPDRRQVTVRCLWTEDDVVDEVMTPADVLLHVAPTTPLGRADRIAASGDIHHLLVGRAGWIDGGVCRCQLADEGSPAGAMATVGERMLALVAVPPGTTLGAAAHILERVPLGMIAVAQAGLLHGVVTLRDLGMDRSHHAP